MEIQTNEKSIDARVIEDNPVEQGPAFNYAVIQSGTVVNIVLWDGNTETWNPPEGSEAILVPEGQNVSIGWTYDGTTFIAPPVQAPPPPTAAEILAANTAVRNSLLANATAAIAPLQDAVDIGEATDADTAMLTKWKTYRVAVNRVVLTNANPTWPTPPDPSVYASSHTAVVV